MDHHRNRLPVLRTWDTHLFADSHALTGVAIDCRPFGPVRCYRGAIGKCASFVSQRHQWIDFRRAVRGHETGKQGNNHQHHCDDRESRRISRTNTEEHR